MRSPPDAAHGTSFLLGEIEMPKQKMRYPVTTDGRYFVVRGRLWRMSDPALSEQRRTMLTKQLMAARRAAGAALKAGDEEAEQASRHEVDRAKRSLGERGPVWWDNAAPDFNRHLARNTPYAIWYADLGDAAGKQDGLPETTGKPRSGSRKN